MTPRVSNADLIAQLAREVDAAQAADLERLDYKILLGAIHELRSAFEEFAPYRTNSKVTIFGSARTQRDDVNYLMAKEFASLMAERDWAVITGGGPGIMEAGTAGAGPTRSFGVGIRLPFEERSEISATAHLLEMKYFFTRKLLMTRESHAFVCFPGGLGTLDEAFEVLTLMQTGKSQVAPLILCEEPQGNYWTDFMAFLRATPLAHDMISTQDLSLIRLSHSASDAAHQVTHFYRRFHSLRTVGHHLIIRMTSPLPTSVVARLALKFADITAEGSLRIGPASPWERREQDHLELPRLWLTFDHRSYGRLRELIDAINDADAGAD